LLADASGGLIAADTDSTISGFAAHGTSIGESLSGLIELCGVALVERDGALRNAPSAPPLLIGTDELGASTETAAAIERLRASDSATPNSLTLTYYEPDRDYQTGQMRASSGHGGARDERIELPAALAGGDAKALAEQALARRWSAGDRVRLHLPPARMGLRPGDVIQLPGVSKAWSVRSLSIEGLAVAIEAEAAPGEMVPLPADPGRSASQSDEPVGRSELALFELPALGDAPAAAAIAYIAAANSGMWKHLPVELRLGQAPLASVALSRRAVLGRTETVLAGRCPPVIDELSTVIVRLANTGQALLNADQNALMAGTNLAIVGAELIQFGRAEQLAPGLYRLSRLLRGRRGTEWAANEHATEEIFCLINRADVRPIELPPGAAGAMLIATAHGVGDLAPLPTVERTIGGAALRPPPPCHARLWRDGSAVRAEWVRRSHRGWAWVDGVADAEDGFPELYRLAVTGPAGTIQMETASRSATWSMAELPGQAGQLLNLSIATVGPQAVSRAAIKTLTL
jgi:hypothetical protein